MIDKRHTDRLELNKILARASEFAVLAGGKKAVLSLEPTSSLAEAKRRLTLTDEATALLFELGSSRVEYFEEVGDAPERAAKGSTLTPKELLDCATLLRSARICHNSVKTLSDERITLFKEITDRLQFNQKLEEEIGEKIIGENEISDFASDNLYRIRREIRLLNERIRSRLQEYLSGEEKKYLQDSLITMRGDRYVLPVKTEYKRSIRGFIHDRSATGQTVFIEPEQILEMNNELRTLTLDEKEEIERILSTLSHSVGFMKEALERDIAILEEVDSYNARAEYGYSVKGVKPIMTDKGVVSVQKGRHPLLDKKTAIPVTVSVGENYDMLLISGANTGGKTVTLKMCGLFSLMSSCGLFVPASQGTKLSVFDHVFCDVGDSQSIEENLSTFSSHVENLKEIVQNATEKSFILIDEPGGGTDPEEGQAIAKACLSHLLKKGAKGIVTTHYSALKEYAFETPRMENGCMEFDADTMRPLYRMKIGAPGSSNALAICTRLGLDESILEEARGYLSNGARTFDQMIRSAEAERVAAENAKLQSLALAEEWQSRIKILEKEESDLKRDKEKFFLTTRAEAKRIINERTAEAEELLSEIEAIFKKESWTESDLIQARTLKNKMTGQTYEEETEKVRNLPVDPEKLKVGDKVFVSNLNTEGVVLAVKKDKKLCEVRCGAMQLRVKFSDLYQPTPKAEEKKKKDPVVVKRDLAPKKTLGLEINVIGLTVSEALPEVEDFIDRAVVSGLSEVKIVHGMGTGKLRAGVHEMLKKHPRVLEFRLGKYGEGESGVTIATLK